MLRSRRAGGVVFAILAVAACCALPALAAVGGGALAAAAGLAVRYWPLSVLGGLALVLGAARIALLFEPEGRWHPADPKEDPRALGLRKPNQRRSGRRHLSSSPEVHLGNVGCVSPIGEHLQVNSIAKRRSCLANGLDQGPERQEQLAVGGVDHRQPAAGF